MAARLTKAGFSITGLDPSPDAREHAEAAGIRTSDDSAAAIKTAETIITILPDDHAVTEFASKHAGDIQPGALWIEMTSSSPATTRRVADEVALAGVELLDAPVSGGVKGADSGTLTVLAGGPTKVLERARPILQQLSSNIVHVGDRAGAGDLAKALNNMLSAVNLTAASEALALARHEGLDLDAFVGAVNTSSGGSHAMTNKVQGHALTGTYNAGFTIDQYRKDLRLAMEAFAASPLQSELGELTRARWDQIAQAGHGAEDHTRIVALIDVDD